MSIKNYFAELNYLPFDYKENLNVNDIALGTKRLVSNSNNYNGYIQKFYNHTKLVTFKLPLIKTDQNFNRKKIDSNGIHTKTNSLVIIRNRDGDYNRNENNSYFTPVKDFSIDKIKSLKKYLKVNLRSESVFSGLTGSKEKDDGSNLYNLKYSNMFITDFNSNLKLTNCYFNKGQKKKSTEIQQLTENYFDYDDSELIYDPKEIFDKKEFYKKMMKEKLFNSEVITKRTKTLERTFNPGTNKEILLSLNSIELKFTNLESEVINSEKIVNKSFTCILPFELLPIFYNFSFELFKIILISGLKFHQNFGEVNIEEDGLFSCVRALLNSQNAIESEIIENFKRGKDNIYKFIWITPNQKFQVELQLPFIEINISKANKKIKKLVDPEILFFLFKIEFVNWEFYCANYMISLIDFRNFLNRLFSKAKYTHIKHKSLPLMNIKQKKFIITSNEESTHKIENEKTKTKSDSVPITSVEQNDLKDKIEVNFLANIFTNELRVNEYSEKDHTLSFLVTAKEQKHNTNETDNFTKCIGYIYRLSSFSVDITNSSGITTRINLNLKQMRILCHLTKFGKIENLLKKLVICDNNKNNYIDLSFFEKFDIKNFTLLDHIFYSSKLKESDFELQIPNDLKVDVKWPKVTRRTIQLSYSNISLNEKNITGEINHEFCNEDKNNHININYNNIEEVILDKNSLNKICVKDIYLMIELIEKEINFLRQRESTDRKTIKMSIPKLSMVNKFLTNNKAKSPKINNHSSFKSLKKFDIKLEQ